MPRYYTIYLTSLIIQIKHIIQHTTILYKYHITLNSLHCNDKYIAI